MDATIELELNRFVDAARAAAGADLIAAVLFGSAAEDRLRAASDVNLVLVLRRLEPATLDALHGPLVVAEAAIRLRTMFLLADEIADAANAFALKFDDIRRRHRVLYGADPFADLEIPRAAAIAQLRQVLLNLLLRLRGQLASRRGRDEQLALAVADAAGPLRACAAELLSLEGEPAPGPREALERVAGRPLPEISEAREKLRLPAGQGARALGELIELCAQLRGRAARLR